MTYQRSKVQQIQQNRMNNARGHWFESIIQNACRYYRFNGIAEVDKTPEPFRVTEKRRDGTFTGRFTALAQPDFKGTLKGGRSIAFEAKYTSTDRMKRSVITDEQMKVLESHHNLGAVVGVCCGIGEDFYFIPWEAWRDMKAIFKRQYVKREDIEKWRIKGQVLFLDYIHQEEKEGGIEA